MRSSKTGKALAMRSMQMLILASILLLTAVAALAQATTGTLKGSVGDANGAVVAGATVTIKNEATGSVATSTTTGDGVFEASNLSPGTYSVTVEAAGFKRSVSTGVNVKVGIINPVEVKLEPGNVNETVTITASTEEIVQRDQSQISATIESRKISDLPSNGAGGGIDTLALLIPGVVANRSGGTNTNGSGLSVNGNRGRANNFQIDGSDNNDLSVAGPALFVDSQDSVQEYQVITNNFSAQYGRNQGAIVNIVTKGGTNEFHGSLFEFHQDAYNLNSLDNIQRASGQTKPNRSLYNVFGGTVGGPVYLPVFGEGPKSVWKGTNKLFFFFDYQGIRNPATFTGTTTSLAVLGSELPRLGATFPGNAVINAYVNNSPFAITLRGPAAPNHTIAGTSTPRAFNLGASATSATGALAAGCPRSITAGSASPAGCGVYTAYLNPATGAPFFAGGPFDVVNIGTANAPNLFQATQYERTVPDPYIENFWRFRFDVRPTSKDSVSFRLLHQRGDNVAGVGTTSAGWLGDVPFGSKNLGGSWTRQISNRFVNEAKIFYQRIGVEFGGGCPQGTPGCIPGPANIATAFTNIAFASGLGLTKTTSAFGTIGPATNLPQGRIGKVYQFADNLTMTRGSHSFIFGAEYKHLNTITPFLPNFNGAFTFGTTSEGLRIINNGPSAESITLGDPTLAFKENDQYYFVQDDYKLRSNLTLNLGVRYEYTGQPINILHDVSLARESNAATALFNPALPLSIRTVPFIPPDKNNFAPRVGFAWSPKYEHGFMHTLVGNDATVVRAGFSIAYDLAYYNILLNVQNGAPFSAALAIPTTSLPVTGSVAPLPANPTGDVVRGFASASGVLPKGVLNPLFLSQTNVAPDFRAPYSEQYSLSIQRQVGRNNVVEARYVGTHGVGLFQNINGNFYIGPLVNGMKNWFGTGIDMPSFANLLPAGTVAQVCTDVVGTLDREDACNNRQIRQAGITTRANSSQSIYHSLQTRYNGRFFRNSVNLGAAYTWSKTIDDSSEIFAESDVISPNAQNPFCVNRCERSLSALDRPHVFSTNFIWDLPWMKKQSGLVGHVLGGWQINGTYILTSGATYTPGQSFNGLFGLGNTYLTAGDRPFVTNPAVDPRLVGISQPDAAVLFGAPLTNINGFYSLNSLNTTGNAVGVTPADVHFIFNGPGAARIFGTPFGNSTRNSLRGPIFNQLNLGLFKNIKIGEKVTFQMRAEFFNALNHPNPGFGTGAGGYLPSINIGNAGLSGAAFANFTDIEYSHRTIQFGARLTF
jgi:outer membrane receptor protein involved in Fe transport